MFTHVSILDALASTDTRYVDLLHTSEMTHTNLVIRPATPSDAEGISNVGRQSFYETFSHSCTPKDMHIYLDSHYVPSIVNTEIGNPQRRYLVAIDSHDSIAGFASLSLDSDESCVAKLFPRVELQRIYVDAKHHGQGVAKGLMEASLELAREMGYRYIWLGVWEENHRAGQFYRKFGFEKVGEHVFTVGSDDQTDWIVVKEL